MGILCVPCLYWLLNGQSPTVVLWRKVTHTAIALTLNLFWCCQLWSYAKIHVVLLSLLSAKYFPNLCELSTPVTSTLTASEHEDHHHKELTDIWRKYISPPFSSCWSWGLQVQNIVPCNIQFTLLFWYIQICLGNVPSHLMALCMIWAGEYNTLFRFEFVLIKLQSLTVYRTDLFLIDTYVLGLHECPYCFQWWGVLKPGKENNLQIS